jgi:hypothetical protein
MKENGSSFRQGMPESSAMDGNVPAAQVHGLGNAAGHRLPSLGDGCIRDILAKSHADNASVCRAKNNTFARPYDTIGAIDGLKIMLFLMGKANCMWG